MFEGWCVGFYPLPEAEITAKVECARRLKDSQLGSTEEHCVSRDPRAVLLDHNIQHLYYINECLGTYCEGFMNPESFDACIHLDADELRNVYRWRLQQEKVLRDISGKGMSNKEVEAFGDY